MQTSLEAISRDTLLGSRMASPVSYIIFRYCEEVMAVEAPTDNQIVQRVLNSFLSHWTGCFSYARHMRGHYSLVYAFSGTVAEAGLTIENNPKEKLEDVHGIFSQNCVVLKNQVNVTVIGL